MNVLGCVIRPDGEWHQVISDPRKNMLLDIKNVSNENEEADFKVILDDKTKVKVGDLSDDVSVIALKEYQKYSDAEEQFLLPADSRLGIKNLSLNYDARKSFFNLNKSWRDSLTSIVERVGDSSVILINGVVNSGKSTFSSCLINQLLTRADLSADVYLMDLDPGQPNYSLAGQVALMRMSQCIMTNTDYRGAEIVKGYYLNTPTPNLNMKYYQACTVRLFEDFKS